VWCRYQQYVGRVTSAAFLTSGQRKRVYVATESGAVAALNLRKGDIGKTAGEGEREHCYYHWQGSIGETPGRESTVSATWAPL